MSNRTYHIVSHTHWDREWYLTFEQFRFRLVELIDDLIGILDTEPRFNHFLLDGQSILLEDYLEIRPQNARVLRDLATAGRIAVGPWYVLADEFLTSGEALVRNLLIGREAARRWGGESGVGYVPDAFGHVAQLPQVLRGFGFDNAFLLRGFGGEKGQEVSEYTWRAPDGSEVLLVHFSKAGYDIGGALPDGNEALRERWEKIEALLLPRAQTPHLLVMNGGDHHWPQKELPVILDALARLRPEDKFVHGTLRGYVDALKATGMSFPEVEGELRFGFRHTYCIQGVYSARVPLKQLNARAQRNLERWAEPFASIAAENGFPDMRPFLETSWKTLLKNHPHDSICGCSTDPVHREMVTRFHKSLELSESITDKCLKLLAFGDDEKSEWERDLYLFVFNPSPFTRSEVVECRIDFILGSIPIGQGSPVKDGPELGEVKGFRIFDPAGREVPFQVLGHDDVFARSDTRYGYPDQKLVTSFEVLIEAGNVPALGFKAFRVEECARMPEYPRQVTVSDRGLENEFLKVVVGEDGSVEVLNKVDGIAFEGLNGFEDSGDVGDEYNYSYPPGDETILSTRFRPSVRILERGPLRGAVEVAHSLSIPARATPDETARSAERTELAVVSRILLAAGQKRVDFRTSVDNNARDHRLRACFPLGRPTDESLADTAFHVVRRKHREYDPSEFEIECPTKTHPMNEFVLVGGRDRSFALITDGLPEYESKLDDKGTLALTLLRCVGKLSGSDLITRRGGDAGWKNDTPDAQCRGLFEGRYAFFPCGPEDRKREFPFEEVEKHNLFMRVLQRPVAQVASRPLEQGFLSIENRDVRFSALKPAQDGDGCILRCWNPLDREVDVEVLFTPPPASVRAVSLSEEGIDSIPLGGDGILRTRIGAFGIQTLRLKYDKKC